MYPHQQKYIQCIVIIFSTEATPYCTVKYITEATPHDADGFLRMHLSERRPGTDSLCSEMLPL